jgi:hypothetical protein
VAELGGRLSSRELNDWTAYAAVEPFGEEQANRRAALIAHTIAAANTPKGKKPPSVEDFLGVLRPAEKRVQTADELRSGLIAQANRTRRAHRGGDAGKTAGRTRDGRQRVQPGDQSGQE